MSLTWKYKSMCFILRCQDDSSGTFSFNNVWCAVMTESVVWSGSVVGLFVVGLPGLF